MRRKDRIIVGGSWGSARGPSSSISKPPVIIGVGEKDIPSPPGGCPPHLLSLYEYYNSSFISLFSFYLQRKGWRDLASLRQGKILPLYSNTSSSKFLLVTPKALLPSLIEGLMGL
jgi:hypothetical protein